MLRRRLGRTGLDVSIISFGGIVVKDVADSDAGRIVAEAVDRGINYFDVAPSYGDAEVRLGPALRPHRQSVYLACKTGKRDRDGAAAELRQSLVNLETDHFDVYQLHGLSRMEELEQALGPNGALETIARARAEGVIRNIGFSAHSVEVALEAIRQFDFDTVLFPINYVLYHEADFGPQVLAAAGSKAIGCLALKGMACHRLAEGTKRTHAKCWYQPVTDPRIASLALRFTLSEPIATAIPPGESSLFLRALDIAEDFRPLDEGERAELKSLARGLEPIFRLAA
jgi:predicted aldo/keto reductase-like oxidoreductase